MEMLLIGICLTEEHVHSHIPGISRGHCRKTQGLPGLSEMQGLTPLAHVEGQ